MTDYRLQPLVAVRFNDAYFESFEIKMKNSTIPFNMTKNALKRTAHDYPKIFLEFDLTETLRNIEVILTTFR